VVKKDIQKNCSPPIVIIELSADRHTNLRAPKDDVELSKVARPAVLTRHRTPVAQVFRLWSTLCLRTEFSEVLRARDAVRFKQGAFAPESG
jgi:hypothetical protein